MKQFRTYLHATILFALIGSSCSSDNDTAELKYIELDVSIQNETATRVNMDGDAFEENDQFRIYFYSYCPIPTAGSEKIISVYQYNGTTEGWGVSTGETPIYWDDRNQAIVRNFCAIMPYDDYDVSGQTYAVQTNQTTQAAYKKSDLLIACTRTAQRLVPVAFKHAYSRLIVKFDDPESSFGTLQYNTITLKEVKTTGAMIYTEKTNDVDGKDEITVAASAQGSNNSVQMHKADDAGNPYFTAILPPQTIAEGTAVFEITVTEDSKAKTYNYKVDVDDLILNQGEQITLTLTLKKSGIEFNNITIAPWGTINLEDDKPIELPKL